MITKVSTVIAIQIPFVMTCQVTGLEKSFTNPEYVAKKLSYFNGDVERMKSTYVCEDAKALLRQGKTVEQVITKLGGNKVASTVDLSKLILDRPSYLKNSVHSTSRRNARSTSKRYHARIAA